MNLCLHCGEPTANAKYCCRAHAAIHTNKQAPKRRPTGKCVVCQTPIHANRTHCPAHKRISSRSEYYDLTVADLKARYAPRHPSYYRGHLNTLTRLLNAHRPHVCQVCGYEKHVEYCHTKPLKLFGATATIREISGPESIFILCPNCHWEYDNGLLRVAPTGFQPVSRP